jgi:hypothetical protein
MENNVRQLAENAFNVRKNYYKNAVTNRKGSKQCLCCKDPTKDYINYLSGKAWLVDAAHNEVRNG